jgi:acyl-CoA synthetase (NDP forming)
MRHPLDVFFNPASVAVIGASTVLHKAGGRRWRSMVEAGFSGPLYPIHPSAREILGRKAYSALGHVPGPVEVAVVLVRPELVRGVIEDCVALGVRGIVVITAGFGETGPAGKRQEQELVEIVRRAGARMIGPNCAGMFSASGRVNALGWGVPAGPVAVISQSGNMALTFAQAARQKGLGFSKLVTIGNSADVRIPEYLDYFFKDPQTKVVVAYLEAFEPGEGRWLFDTMRAHPTPKPVVVIKPGATESGKRAALSHTGALAGEHRVSEAAFRQCGILHVAESDDAWDVALALAQAPRLRGDSIVVIADGGGHATIVCETADRLGLKVPPLGGCTRAKLTAILPPRSSIGNPVDFAGVAEEAPEVVPRVLEACLQDPAIDGAILAGHFGGYVKIATEELGRREEAAAGNIIETVSRHGKPVIVHTIYAGEPLPALQKFQAAGLPTYRALEASAKAMAALRRPPPAPQATPRRSAPDQAEVARLLGLATGSGRRLLLEPEARSLIAAYGISVPAFQVGMTPGESDFAARKMGVPVAMKLVIPGLNHKTEAGGVLLNVAPEAAAGAHRLLLERAAALGESGASVLVTPMVGDALEAVVGAFRDLQFGPVVMFGLGGIWVEALSDIAFRLAPLTTDDARAMIAEIRGRALLAGSRGQGARDIEALVDVLVRVGELVSDRDNIAEFDVNPLFLLEHGAVIGDARIVVA